MLPILHQSYWRDEAFSVLLSAKSLQEILALAIKDTSPPLYYFLLHLWMRLFGDAEYVTRTLSLGFHLLLAFSSLFLLQYLIKNWKMSVLGSLAVFLNPFLLEYAFEARGYSLFALLVVTSTNFFLRKKYFLSSIFLTGALLTHNFAIFFLFAYVVFWISENRSSLLANYRSAIALFSLPIITFGTWSIFLWNQWTKVANFFWIGPQDSSIFIDAFRTYFQGSTDYSLKGMVYNLTIVLVVLALFYVFYKYVHDDHGTNDNGGILAFNIAIPFLVVYLISAYWVPIFHERYLIPILPLFIVWITSLLFHLSKLKISLSHFVLAVSVAYIIFLVQGSEEIVRKSTKPAINYGVQQVLSQFKDGDVIVPKTELNFLEIKYYANKWRPNTPVLAYIPDGSPVFYIGAVLFEESEIIRDYPTDRRVWIIEGNGASYLKSD